MTSQIPGFYSRNHSSECASLSGGLCRRRLRHFSSRSAAIIILLTFLPACDLFRANAKDHSEPEIQKGILDLRYYSAANGPVPLEGKWEFHWQALLPPSSSTVASLADDESIYMPVPGFWNKQRLDGLELHYSGYATYRLRILRSPEPDILAVRMIDLESAYRLYANGTLIGANGKPGTGASEEIPEWRPAVHTFYATGNVDLVLQVSNFHHRLGGVWQPPEFGTADVLLREQRHRIALDVCLAAALFAIGIYHTLIYLLRRAEPPFLLLGLFCVIMGLRSLVVGERFLLEILPLEWVWLIRLDYLTVYAGAPVCHWYLFQVYRQDYSRIVAIAFLIVSGLASLVVLCLPPMIFTRIAETYHFLFILISLYFTAVTVIAVIRRRPDSIIMMLGWLAFTVANMHDVLYVQSYIESQNLFAFGLLAFLLTQSYTLAGRYARALGISEELRERVRRLLLLTRTLNQAGESREAIRQALQAGAQALNVSDMRACVREDGLIYEVRVDEPEMSPLEDCDPVGIQEISFGISNGFSSESSSNGAEKKGTVRAPARKGKEFLARLQWDNVTESAFEREREFLMGLCDSLALTLDSLRSARRATLAAIGQAASEIVHDINHHCRTILQQAEVLRSNPEEGQVVAINIDRETERLKNMALDILDFARENIIVSVRTVEFQVIQQQLEQDLKIHFQGSPVDYSLQCSVSGSMPLDLSRFRRVVANLAGNARNAMEQGGSFRILIEREGDQVFFIFEDDGPGLPAEIQGQLLDGFPGEPPGSGAGFGLAVVRRIVRGHGGEIHVHSSAGGGTRFTVVLPTQMDREGSG